MNCDYQRSFDAVYKMLEGEQSGVISVRASSYGNEDVYGDIFEKGAFAESISDISKENKMPMLWQHSPDSPIGHWYKAWDDDKYLYMEGKMSLGVQKADEAYINLKNGDIGGVSIGFNSIEDKRRNDENGNYEGMTFSKVRLMENSIVTFPANSMAGVDDVKSKMKSITEFERFLRDAGGFSREQAKAIVAGGYRSYVEKFDRSDVRDAMPDQELIAAIAAFDPFKI